MRRSRLSPSEPLPPNAKSQSRARTREGFRRSPIVLDLRDLGVNPWGVGRVLEEVGPRIMALAPDRCRAICTEAALPALPDIERNLLTFAPRSPHTFYEQWTLPFLSTRVGARAVYSHRECGALWGPPLVLHVTEDPEIRWSQESLSRVPRELGISREIARRAYSRRLMNSSLHRARLVTSSRVTALDLERNHGIDSSQVRVIPLGVDLNTFRPHERPERGEVPYLFHLGTNKLRDNTELVIESFAQFIARHPDPVRLVVAGELDLRAGQLKTLVGKLAIEQHIEFTGWISDPRLAELYSGAIAVVQASMNEGFGLQTLEALACGALLVSTRAPATLEIAALADVEWAEPNVESMVSALRAALKDPDRRIEAARTNRAVASRFSWDRTAESLLEILIEVAEN